jgi:hypothetical protein
MVTKWSYVGQVFNLRPILNRPVRLQPKSVPIGNRLQDEMLPHSVGGGFAIVAVLF